MRHEVRHFWRLTMSDLAVNTHRQRGFGQNADANGRELFCSGARREQLVLALPFAGIAGPRSLIVAGSSPLVQYSPSRQMRPACSASLHSPKLSQAHTL